MVFMQQRENTLRRVFPTWAYQNALRKLPPGYFRVTDWSLDCRVESYRSLSNAEVQAYLALAVGKTCVRYCEVFNLLTKPKAGSARQCAYTRDNYVLNFVPQFSQDIFIVLLITRRCNIREKKHSGRNKMFVKTFHENNKDACVNVVV